MYSIPSDAEVRPCRALCLQTSDFDELASAFKGWHHQFHQLSGGTFSGELRVVQAGAVQLSRVSANQVIQSRGTHPAGVYIFIPIMASNESAIWRGQHLQRGQIAILGPYDVVDHRT